MWVYWELLTNASIYHVPYCLISIENYMLRKESYCLYSQLTWIVTMRLQLLKDREESCVNKIAHSSKLPSFGVLCNHTVSLNVYELHIISQFCTADSVTVIKWLTYGYTLFFYRSYLSKSRIRVIITIKRIANMYIWNWLFESKRLCSKHWKYNYKVQIICAVYWSLEKCVLLMTTSLVTFVWVEYFVQSTVLANHPRLILLSLFHLTSIAIWY